jgi:hypothetical protein
MTRGTPIGKRCTICQHAEKKRIEKKLLSGPRRLRATAKEFGVSYFALRRHWIAHVTAAARAQYIAGGGVKLDELVAVVADESCSYLDHYKIVRARLYDALDGADRNLVPLIAGRLHENLRDCARLTGELQRGPLFQQNNVVVNADSARVFARIISALRGFPEAQRALIPALRELDAGAVING